MTVARWTGLLAKVACLQAASMIRPCKSARTRSITKTCGKL